MDKLDLIKLGMMHSLKNSGVKGEVTLKLAATMMVRRKKRKGEEGDEDGVSLKTPLTALGITGAGYGLKRLGDYALTPEDRATADDLIALKSRLGKTIAPAPGAGIAARMLPSVEVNPTVAGSRSLFYDYIDRASKASKVHVYGQPVVPVIHKIKDTLGIDQPPPPGTKLTPLDIENNNHYPAFEAGPVPAYLHQVRKVLLDKNWDPWLFKPGGKGTDVLAEGSKVYGPRFEQAWKDYTAQLAPAGTDSLNHGKQMDLVRGFDGWLSAKDPELAKAKEVMETNLADAQRWASNAYASGAEKAVALAQDWPRRIGKGMMIAGGTLGTMWIAKKLLDMRKERQKKEKEHQRMLAAHRKQYSDNHPSLMKAAAPAPTAVINGAKTLMSGIGYGDRIVGDGNRQGFYKDHPLEAGVQALGDATTLAKFIPPSVTSSVATQAAQAAPKLMNVGTKLIGPALKAVGPAATIYSYGKGAVNAAVDPQGTYNAVDTNLKDTGSPLANGINMALQGYSDPVGTMAATGMAAKGLWDARKDLSILQLGV